MGGVLDFAYPLVACHCDGCGREDGGIVALKRFEGGVVAAAALPDVGAETGGQRRVGEIFGASAVRGGILMTYLHIVVDIAECDGLYLVFRTVPRASVYTLRRIVVCAEHHAGIVAVAYS